MARRVAPARARLPAPVFAALGDETRLQLVDRLCTGGRQSITALTEGSQVTRQAITKHLHVLAEAGLVHGIRIGRETMWELKLAELEVAQRYLDAISQRWDDALERLRRSVEE